MESMEDEDFEKRLQRALRAEKEEEVNWFSAELFHELLRRYQEQQLLVDEQQKLMGNLLEEQTKVQTNMRQYFERHWGEYGVAIFTLMMKDVFTLPELK